MPLYSKIDIKGTQLRLYNNLFCKIHYIIIHKKAKVSKRELLASKTLVLAYIFDFLCVLDYNHINN